jgi:methylmalonyl-CoA mutase
MEMDPTSLSPFEPPTLDEWRRAVDAVLAKGQDLTAEQLAQAFERRLTTTTYDGIRVQPLYMPSDAPELADSWPGSSPFLRGSSAPGGIVDGWEVRQRVLVTGDGTGIGEVARGELERGTTGLWLDLTAANTVDVDTLDRALEGVFLELVPISLSAGGRGVAAAHALMGLWERRGHGAEEIRGRLGLDPVAAILARGGQGADLDAAYVEIVEVVATCRDCWPGVRSLVADATVWHGAGASDTEQLAIGVASILETLRRLDAAGIAPRDALGQIELRLAAGPDQFLTIATIRAARLIWARLAEVFGVDAAQGAPRIHAVTADAMFTQYDPWVNMLRSTVACFAAGVGGADAVTVTPHDALGTQGRGSELGRRMARNTQAVLLDESHLGRVIDPAGGSWYLERLTRSVAEVAWETLTEIEAEGGFAAGVVSGALAARCAATWQRRRHDVATRRSPITGVSEFPNIDDQITVAAAAASSEDHSVEDLEIPALVTHRYAEDFEALRRAGDDHLRRHGARPEIVLVGVGTPADHTARVTFAKNLFEAGGLSTRLVELSSDSGSWPDVLARSEIESRLVCVCSSDQRYSEVGVDAVRAVSAAGATRVYLAGRPAGVTTDLDNAGVDEFVALGIDAVEVLSRALVAAGVDLDVEGAAR